MNKAAHEPLVSYPSAQAEAADHQNKHQRDPWGIYEAKPRIHQARMEDAGSLLAYRQNSGIDLYDIIDGRSANTVFTSGNRDQGDLYEERRSFADSGSFDEYAEALMPRRAKIEYPSKGPAGEPFPLRASGSGRLTIEYTGKAGAALIEQARSPIPAPDLYDISGKERRRPEVASPGKAITKRDGKSQGPVTHIALARAPGSGRGTPGGGAPSRGALQAPALPAAGLPQENLKGAGTLQTARGSMHTEERVSLNGPPQQISSSTEQSGRKIETDHQDVPEPLLSTAPQPSAAASFAPPLLTAETAGSLLISSLGSLSGPLVLRDPDGSAPLAAEGQAAQTSSLVSLREPDTGEGEIYAETAPGGAPGPAPETAGPAPAAKTDGGGTPGPVLKMDARKDGPRERSGGVFSFFAASPDSAPGQNKIYRGIPTPRLDAVTHEDRDVRESGRRWWGKNFYGR